MSIGLFDSGVGGLTVLKEIHHLLPKQKTIYFGDTARVPYGAKTPEQLLTFAREIIDFLLEKNVKAVVIACGTSGSYTYDKLVELYPTLPLVDVIRPGVDLCANLDIHRFGLIGTVATIRSGVFARLLKEKRPEAEIYPRACPLFASMIEAGLKPNHPALRFAAESYLADMKGNIDALIMGCTHYPLLADVFRDILGDVKLINLGEATAIALKNRLQELNLTAGEDIPKHEFYVSSNPENFAATGKLILEKEILPLIKPLGH